MAVSWSGNPKTWATNDPLVASEFNTEIRDRFDWLKDAVASNNLKEFPTSVATSGFIADVTYGWAGSPPANTVLFAYYDDGSGYFVSYDTGTTWVKFSSLISATYDGDYSTTSSTWADVDATNLSLTFNSNGGILLLFWRMSTYISTSGIVGGYGSGAITFTIDGTRVTNGASLYNNSGAWHGNVNSVDQVNIEDSNNTTGKARLMTGVFPVIGIAAGTHTINLQFAEIVISAGNPTFYIRGSSVNSNYTDAFIGVLEI